jgi:regulator of protease activity HflC (stomatin/prohibitin superfamily)
VEDITDYIVPIIIGLVVLAALFSTFFIVQQQEAEVVERFGRFKRVAKAGLNVKVPFIDRVAGNISLQIQELKVEVETKTKDNVFVIAIVSVQYLVLEAHVFEAFYKLSDPRGQITSYVFDVVRAKVPTMDLDTVFENKDEVATAVKDELSDTMDDFGYAIIKALVTDIDPDANVKQAMNEINAAQRERVAASERGEADRILKVKAAQADAESKKLQGEGIANQRKAIIAGLKESVKDFEQAIPGAGPQDAMNMVLLTQYFDTLKEVGGNSRTNLLLVPHSPSAVGDIAGQIREAMLLVSQTPRPEDAT